MRKAILLAAIIASLIPLPGWNQSAEKRTEVKPTVYIDAVEPLASSVAEGIRKKHVPVVLIRNKAEAQYTVTLSERLTGWGSFALVTMTVVDSRTGSLVFVHTCTKLGGRTGALGTCLAKRWGKSLRLAAKIEASIPAD